MGNIKINQPMATQRRFRLFAVTVVLLFAGILAVQPLMGEFIPLDKTKNQNPPQNTQDQKKTTQDNSSHVTDPSTENNYRPNIIQRDQFPEDLPRNISAQLSSSNEIEINWEFKINIKGKKFALFRYNEPIVDYQIMKKADVVGAFTPQESRILDRGLSMGKYYYAVVNVEQITKKKVELYPGVNFTTVPVIVGRVRSSNSDNPQIPLPVKNISAKIEYIGQRKYITINWQYDNRSDVSFIIYRAKTIIDNEEALKKAKKVAEIRGESRRYIDYDEKVNGSFYYAITTRFIYDDKSENRTLIKGKPQQDINYLSIPVTLSNNFGNITVRNIRAEALSTQVVWLAWALPRLESGVLSNLRLNIYRSDKMIQSLEQLTKSRRIASLEANQRSFLDNAPGLGLNYYAIVLEYAPGKEIPTLTKAKNFTDTGVEIKKTDTQKRIAQQKKNSSKDNKNQTKKTDKKDSDKQTNKQSKKKNGNKFRYSYNDFLAKIEAHPTTDGVMVRWDWQKTFPQDIPDAYVYLVRTYKVPFDFNSVRESGIIVDQFRLKERKNGYMDPWDNKNQERYYALLIGRYENKVLPMDFIMEVNTVLHSVEKPAQKKEIVVKKKNHTDKQPLPDKKNADNDQKHMYLSDRQRQMAGISNILNDYFYHRRYKKTFKALARYVKSRDKAVKSKAMLYQGRSLYQLGQYRNALPYFLDEIVVKLYPDEANFWQKSIYRKMR